jgi:hypothetical protein
MSLLQLRGDLLLFVNFGVQFPNECKSFWIDKEKLIKQFLRTGDAVNLQ